MIAIFLIFVATFFLVVPYFVSRGICSLLELRGCHWLFYFPMAWLTWDFFQREPVIWYSRVLWPDGHGNDQIMVTLMVAFIARYLWLDIRTWWARPPKSKRAYNAGENVAKVFLQDSFDPKLAAAFAETPLISAAASHLPRVRLVPGPPAGRDTKY
jgi:hypothetical protein